jgi:hypothetical protein
VCNFGHVDPAAHRKTCALLLQGVYSPRKNGTQEKDLFTSDSRRTSAHFKSRVFS